MQGHRALAVKSPIDYEYIDAFRKCRYLHEKIGFVLDKLEESVGEICPRVSRREVVGAEKCLDEAEKSLWMLVLKKMTAGALTAGSVQSVVPVTRVPEVCQQPMNAQLECVQREVLTRHSPVTNNQVVRVQRRVQVQNVAVQHVDPAPEKSLPAANKKPVVNLLVDWFLTLGEAGVHLEGMLLNEGHWKTSVIAERVGPLTVKTCSGTTYNMSGEICPSLGQKAPDFVYDKFQYGFPDDWKEVVEDWMSYAQNEKRPVTKQNVVALQKENMKNPVTSQLKPEIRVHERVQRDDQDKMPPPKRTPRLQRRAQSQEDVRKSRQYSIMDRSRQAEKVDMKTVGGTLSPQHRRASNRILMRSLNDVSMNSSAMNNSQDLSVDVNGLKKWCAESLEETGELVLRGQLVSDNQHVIDRNFISASVIRRLQADLVETSDGEIYRLIGPSISADKKLYTYGFPLQWKNCLKKGAFPSMSLNTNTKASRKQVTSSDKGANLSQNAVKNVRNPQNSNSRSSAAEKNSPQPSLAQQKQQRRTSQMIQHIVRHNIKQSQNSTLGNASSRSLMSKTDVNSGDKRKNRSLLPLQPTGALKKMRMDDSKGQGGVARSRQNGSEMDVSVQSELNWKEAIAREWQAIQGQQGK
ncbi:uncharacterized protein LOC124159262 isoform X2 [Ischnura elegans]|uniref:uncharacterized protein LOC124159262 isoform X2 n=1 Tax=Ischnura elegans TaxID=197161 RepID=UPI001ED875F0|nr:uncharacterized protein LOC124159262 isoform X2 [Ischnura elegans]